MPGQGIDQHFAREDNLFARPAYIFQQHPRSDALVKRRSRYMTTLIVYDSFFGNTQRIACAFGGEICNAMAPRRCRLYASAT